MGVYVASFLALGALCPPLMTLSLKGLRSVSLDSKGQPRILSQVQTRNVRISFPPTWTPLSIDFCSSFCCCVVRCFCISNVGIVSSTCDVQFPISSKLLSLTILPHEIRLYRKPVWGTIPPYACVEPKPCWIPVD
jgi:hypothetical protein